MGKKYIIKLDDNKLAYTAIIIDGVPYIKPLQLLPYTEPDLEQVREKAYMAGFKDGEENAYQRGMDDANRNGEYNVDDGWYVMQKISLLPNPIKTELFGTAETAVILQDNSFKDALAKLTEYEQEKEAFHVGDEFVNGNGDKFVITKMDGEEIDRYIDESGKTYAMNVKYNKMRKTGRHFPEIAEVLAKMKE